MGEEVEEEAGVDAGVGVGMGASLLAGMAGAAEENVGVDLEWMMTGRVSWRFCFCLLVVSVLLVLVWLLVFAMRCFFCVVWREEAEETGWVFRFGSVYPGVFRT